MTTPSKMEVWASRLKEVTAWIAPRVARWEPRRPASAYLRWKQAAMPKPMSTLGRRDANQAACGKPGAVQKLSVSAHSGQGQPHPSWSLRKELFQSGLIGFPSIQSRMTEHFP